MNNRKLFLVVQSLLFVSQIFAASCGDVDANGSVNIVNALLITKYYVGRSPSNFNKEMAIIVENCVFDMGPKAKAFKMMSHPGWRGVLGRANIEESKKGYPMNPNEGKIFKTPYKYNLIPAAKVEETVTANVGGAGNTCVFKK